MKKEIMKKWVRALRSGKYKQTTGKLADWRGTKEVSYCCLGVLCEIRLKEMPKAKIDFEDEFLTPATMKWAGMTTDNGMLSNFECTRLGKGFLSESLASENDNGTSFDVIADIIEDTWVAL